MNFDQADFEVRLEWGKQGVLQLAPNSDVVIVVDVLSFSTCVEIANSRGAIVYPYQWKDESATLFAQSVQAELAGDRGDQFSLSPSSLLSISAGTRLVLPSPNGASLSLATNATLILAGCLRNCRAVAIAAMQYGRNIAVVPAGERWPDDSLRPAFEDWIAAGAIVTFLNGCLSPEAQVAAIAYQGVQSNLGNLLKQCGSGQELIARGFASDVELATQLDVSDCVPMLVDGAYVNRAASIERSSNLTELR
ncbi:2-phosphosulfolactate phosphatase [Microcoleus sp. FACHB-1515]|uniref:2-phosphosulfolactate phosphatase n=1 Tax=Cyanophyceae TaxID=3028117 RepID=UPI001689EB59|nr:2-phosphosulfolactate phosphatase [Microcoleus sp. FACHB-1515]MBD2089131.1 2-phosphosulfolactate phosphatase [Microcoleus sp. FACHB-1515]